VKMKYKDAHQKEATSNGGYAAQLIFHKGWLVWRGKNKIFEV
jgi:hypothetical protein